MSHLYIYVPMFEATLNCKPHLEVFAEQLMASKITCVYVHTVLHAWYRTLEKKTDFGGNVCIYRLI